MSVYDQMRHFADTWGLLFIFGVFIVVVARLMLPGAKEAANEAAQIPFKDYDKEP
jgi:cytochrome c oxidase cbb3-type subunit 4